MQKANPNRGGLTTLVQVLQHHGGELPQLLKVAVREFLGTGEQFSERLIDPQQN